MREIEQFGCTLIPGAIPAETVVRYRDALDQIYASSTGSGDVDAATFAAQTALPLERLFGTPLLSRIAREMLRHPTAFNGTFMSVSGKQANSTPGIGMHTDGIIQGTRQNILCMWAPLHPCGESAPGLALVKAGRDQVLAYLRRHFPGKELPGWHSETDWSSTAAFTEDALRREFGEPWKPVMHPGDVLLFTNWTIHGSHITAQMMGRRSAAIYRLHRKRLLQRFGDYELELLGRRRSVKSWVRGNVA